MLSVLPESVDNTNFRPVTPGSCYMELNEIIRISYKVSMEMVI